MSFLLRSERLHHLHEPDIRQPLDGGTHSTTRGPCVLGELGYRAEVVAVPVVAQGRQRDQHQHVDGAEVVAFPDLAPCESVELEICALLEVCATVVLTC